MNASRSICVVTVDSSECFAIMVYMYVKLYTECLQCFDAVGWAAGRASGL